ncbi:CPBP family intramembrane glutamic endopeptidase [Paraclostridium bifermentans]|uniref:CPBP family intramembrane glutamic endopeptidase n=1 Tax=Paraclostridium bifermentans TaxID=1490 RepID=UPI00359CACA7
MSYVLDKKTFLTKFKTYFLRVFLFVILLLGFNFLSGIITIICAGIYSTFLGEPIDFMFSEKHYFSVESVGQIFSIAALYFIFKSFDKNLFKLCKFNKLSKKEILDVIGLSLGLKLIIGCFSSVIFYSFFSHTGTEALDSIHKSLSMSFGAIISVVIVGPVFEEIVFRGLCVGFLKNKIGMVPTIFTQAILFGIAHGNMEQFITASILGLILGLIFLYTNSIYSSIIFHIIFNGSAAIISINCDKSFIYTSVIVILFISSTILLFFSKSICRKVRRFIKYNC